MIAYFSWDVTAGLKSIFYVMLFITVPHFNWPPMMNTLQAVVKLAKALPKAEGPLNFQLYMVSQSSQPAVPWNILSVTPFLDYNTGSRSAED